MSDIILTAKEFTAVQKLVFKEVGIVLAKSKRLMAQTRLYKRLKYYKLRSYSEYLKIVQTSKAEKIEMLNQISTNETYFFREQMHFDFLSCIAKEKNSIRVWSGATSLGSEAYSIAMVLDDVLGLKWEVVGSDINTEVLKKAKEGLYPFSWIEKIPTEYQKKYCLKGKGKFEKKFLIDKSLSAGVHFEENNLMQKNSNFGQFDIIFLRNVLLYFNEETKLQVVKNVISNLKKDGYLLIGMTENFDNKKIEELQYLNSSIFQKVL